MNRLGKAGEITYALLRIGAGFLFMFHGAQKLFGWFGGFGGTPGAKAELLSLMGLAGVLEFVGGALIVVGLLTRPVAIVLVAEMAAAYFIAHVPHGFVPIENQGELAVLYALVFLCFAGNGGGRYSVDHTLGRGVAEDRIVEARAGHQAGGRSAA